MQERKREREGENTAQRAHLVHSGRFARQVCQDRGLGGWRYWFTASLPRKEGSLGRAQVDGQLGHTRALWWQGFILLSKGGGKEFRSAFLKQPWRRGWQARSSRTSQGQQVNEAFLGEIQDTGDSTTKGEFQRRNKYAGPREARAGGVWVSAREPGHYGKVEGDLGGSGGTDLPQGCKHNSSLFKTELCLGPRPYGVSPLVASVLY